MFTFSFVLVDVHFRTRVLSCVLSGLALVDFCVVCAIVCTFNFSVRLGVCIDSCVIVYAFSFSVG
jgi:hypothetical protein